MIRTTGRFARRLAGGAGWISHRPVLVLVLWLAVVGAGFGIGVGVFGELVGDVGTVPGSESDRAAQRLDDAAPEAETLTAVISGRPAGDPALRESAADAIARVRAMPGVTAVSDPLPSAESGSGSGSASASGSGEALLVEVTLAPDSDLPEAEAAAEALRGIDAPRVSVAGGPLSDAEFNGQAQEDVAQAELLSMPVVLVLLLLFFGGLLAAGLPLLIAAASTGATFGILYAFSAVTDVSVYAIQVTTMLAVGLAVDYALLMVSRFREELGGRAPGAARWTAADVASAIDRTVATAGRTVLFSGLTVAAALLGLTVFPDPFLRSMGLAGAAVVLVDMVAALTLLPALLRLLGKRIKPAKPRTGGVLARLARAVQRRPVLTLVVTAGALLVVAGPVLDMRISQGDARMLPAATDTRQMWDDLTTYYPERTGPSDIEVVAHTGAGDPAVADLRDRITAVPGITEVEVAPAGPDLAVLRATPGAPTEDALTLDAVAAIRDLPAPFEVEVAGTAAMMVDYQAMLAQRLPWAIALVALGTLLLLFAFTGSLVLPVKAVLTNLLSIGAALGVVVWVFQQGHLAGLFGTEGLGYVHLSVPVLVGAIAFGLSVDYEVFLLSRIRERWLAGAGPRASVSEGLQSSGRIVTAAALIIAVVFAGFIPGGFAPIKAVGLGLVLAIVLDATVVRMLLVPATMTLLGRRNWWLPRRLARVHARLAVSEEAAPEPPHSRSQPALVP